MLSRLAPLFLTTALLAALPEPQEALSLAFPGAQFTRREQFLTEAQGRRVRELAGTELGSLWNVLYEARRDGLLVGVGYFDTHRVRTLNETLLVAVAPDGRLRRVEVVAFREPQEYLPRAAWIKQFDGRRLDAELSQQRGIRPLSGATLSAQAMTDAVRRSLALHAILYPANQ